MKINPDNLNADFRKEEAYLRAKKKVDSLVGFYWHLAIFFVVNLFLIILVGTSNNSGFWSFSTFATPLFWGVGLLFHFLGVFGPDFLFGKKWEQKKVQEYIEKEKRGWE